MNPMSFMQVFKAFTEQEQRTSGPAPESEERVQVAAFLAGVCLCSHQPC